METVNLGNIYTQHQDENITLFSGSFPPTKIPVVIAAGSGVIVKHTVLGKISASGKYAPYDNGASDGTETARVILGHDVDATTEDIKSWAWRTGQFNQAALVGLDDAAKEDFEGTPILLGTIAD